MLTVSHITVGAAVGSFLPQTPIGDVVAFGLGVTSHYLLDKIPHWENWLGTDVHGFPSGTPLKQMPVTTIIGGVVDFVAAVIIFYFFYRAVGHGLFYTSPIFWGAIGGFFPDLLDNIPILSELTIYLPGVRRERAFHSRVHISEESRRAKPYWLGLATQLVTIGLGLAVLFR